MKPSNKHPITHIVMKSTKDRIQKILGYASIKLSSVVYLNHFAYTTIFGSIHDSDKLKYKRSFLFKYGD